MNALLDSVIALLKIAPVLFIYGLGYSLIFQRTWVPYFFAFGLLLASIYVVWLLLSALGGILKHLEQK